MTDDRTFERAVLPLLRASWPDTVGVPARRTFDRAGIDHLVWSDSRPFPLVVQCKGFQVHEQELGREQVRQCLASIQSFARSGLTTKVYLLVHNRPGKSAEFRQPIQQALSELMNSGCAEKAELWDLSRILTEAFNSVLKRVQVGIRQWNLSVANIHARMEPELCTPLDVVPLQTSELLVDQHRLLSSSKPTRSLADPSTQILAAHVRLCVVIGEAGFGKTTAALRSFGVGNRQVLYVPGASISDRTVSTKDLLEQCVSLDTLLRDVQDSDQPTLSRIARPVIAHILKDPETPMILMIDGVDESVYLCRRGGIQSLLNLLREVRVPIVLLARSELWHERQGDFTASFGAIARHGIPRRQRIRLIELLPWSDDEIRTLASRYRTTIADPEQRARVDVFIRAIQSGDYTRFYGDIPRRPLFLRFILETVAERDVHEVGRAALFQEWAELKIRRDVTRPMNWGVVGRPPVTSHGESIDMVVYLAFCAMATAAYRMTQVHNGSLELTPSCSLDEVLSAERGFSGITDSTGLFLNSLLVPLPRASVGERLRLRFAHRAYQEFFLARHLTEHPDLIGRLQIPRSITMWMSDISRLQEARGSF